MRKFQILYRLGYIMLDFVRLYCVRLGYAELGWNVKLGFGVTRWLP